MHAFVERLEGSPILIVRAGPVAIVRPDPFDFAAVAEVVDGRAIIHALANPLRCPHCEDRQKLEMAHARAAFDAVQPFSPNGVPRWDRYK